MSLSSAIIHGTTQQVMQLLQAGAPVNVTDEYGYTPLIQAAIMQKVDVAKILLEHGADVNRHDLTGGTPLHWAVDNNHYGLCQLLLKHGAEVNAYTEAGESVAVKPILRRQSDLRQLLHKHQVDFNFARDFINAKLLGHRFELKGYVDIVDSKGYFVEIDLEGFFLEFTIDTMYQSLLDFHASFLSKHLQQYLPVVEQLLHVFQTSRQLIKYEHFNVDIHSCQPQIDQLLEFPIRLLPVSYEGHAITFIQYGKLLAKCDRSHNEDYTSNVMLYQMDRDDAFDKDFMRKLMYKRQHKQFIDKQLPNMLGLQPFLELPIGAQITGNCSWANVEASIPVILFYALLSTGYQAEDLERHRKFAVFFYQQWREWDKDRALHYCISQFKDASPTRKSAMISLLAAVLLQRCSADIERDVARARKIVPILRTPGFEYVIDSYIEVYCNHYPSKAGENFKRLLRLADEL